MLDSFLNLTLLNLPRNHTERKENKFIRIVEEENGKSILITGYYPLPTNNMLFLYTPTPNEKIAKKIAKCLLEKHLVACANIFPISSMYWWEGKIAAAKRKQLENQQIRVIADEKEVVLLLKTEKRLANRVEAEVKKIHPYSIPCIAQIPVKVNKEYGKWVRGEVDT